MVDGDNPPRSISTSWGQCEAQLPPAYIQAEASMFQQAVAQGQTVVAAAGDEGSEDCYVFPSSTDTRLEVDDPAGQPWVTSVGGTTLDALGPAPVESVWNIGPVRRAPAAAGSRRRGPCRRGNAARVSRASYTKAQDTFTGAPAVSA